jgi:TonB-linked SusC/RagA family outer membrane protein
MQKILLLCCLLVANIALHAQDSSIVLKGIVFDDATKTPLRRASIEVLTTHVRSFTDSSGKFEIRVPKLPTALIVRHVGYQLQQLELISTAPLTVLLTSTQNQLENVTVSTGYQQIPKERSTGSFATIPSTVLQSQPGTGILERLSNVTSSLLIDTRAGRPPFTIRGLSSINGPKDPLIIVDNFPFEGDINSINPADVENVTVLKDAAAASIWGARAGNGVIVITLKKGKFNQPLQVQFGTNLSLSNATNLSYLRPIASADYIDVEQFLFSKGFYMAQENNINRPALSPIIETLIAVRDGKLSKANGDAFINALKTKDVRSDYTDRVYQNGFNQQYHVSMRGGSTNISTLFAAGYDKNVSDLAANFERMTLRSDNRVRLSTPILLTATIAYTGTRSLTGKQGYGSTLINTTQQLYPYASLFDALGNASVINMFRKIYTDTAGAGRLLDWKLYPLDEYQYNQTRNNETSLLISPGAEINFNKQLRLDLKFQSESQQTGNNTLHDLRSYFTRNQINRFTQIDATGKVTYIIPKGSILDRTNSKLQSLSGRAQLNYDKAWRSGQLVAVGGVEIRESASTSESGRTYGYNAENLTYQPVDYVNTYPVYTTGSKVQIASGTDFGQTDYRFVSTYFNGAYTYHNRYTVSASARRDAANIFGLATNDKWSPLWSAGCAWKISSEPFYHFNALPSLKLRMSYGYSGNVDASRSAFTTLSYGSVATYTNYPYASIRQFANPSLRWEKVRMFNAGIDFAMFGILDGSLEYYQKKATDLYGNAPIDYTSGAGDRIVKNVADMRGTGFDLTLHATLIRKQLNWSVSLLSSYNNTRVLRNYLPSLTGSNFINAGVNVSAEEGRPVYGVYSYRWAGLDPTNGNPIGIFAGSNSTDYAKLTGATTTISDLVYSGPATPTFFGSLQNEFAYKNFDLKVMISYKAGHYFRRSSLSYSALFAGASTHSDYALRWQQPGDEQRTVVPSLVYPAVTARDAFFLNSDALVEKADHVRLEFVRLSYRARMRAMNSIYTADVFVHVANLGLLWRANKNSIDPDYVVGIPPSASFTVGIQFNF